jgi:SCP-2 sterol transfer family
LPVSVTSAGSAALLEAEPERDLPGLADRMEAAVAAVLQASQGRGADDIVMWNGQPIGLAAMLGIGLAEFLLHGRDLAHALSQPWPIEAGDARLVLASALPLLPLLVDPVTTAHARATYDLRVRGGAQLVLAIENGRLRVDAPGAPVDCHVSADPVALLLVAYGRTSQWGPILTGKLVAWGRKPWLGPKLVSYLVAP